MELIEAILYGVQCKRLEKPAVFVSMLICFLVFTVIGLVIIFAGIEAFIGGKAVLPSLGISAVSLLFFSLSAACSYLIKRSVE